jgi:HEAT repeat protein
MEILAKMGTVAAQKQRCPWPSRSWARIALLACFYVLGFLPIGCGSTDHVSQLISRLKTEHDSAIRIAAARELGEIGNPRAGEIGDPRAIEALVAALKDPDVKVQMEVAELLRKIGPRAVGPLIAALKKDSSMWVRRGAANVLGSIGDPRAIEPLSAASRDLDVHVSSAAAWALEKIHYSREVEPMIEPMIAALGDRRAEVRKHAAGVLAGIYDLRANHALLAAYRKPDYAAIAGAYSFFLSRREPGSEDALITALDKFGYPDMATAFLNCGNSKLEAAGDRWATHHGYSTTRLSVPGGGNPRWGSGR